MEPMHLEVDRGRLKSSKARKLSKPSAVQHLGASGRARQRPGQILQLVLVGSALVLQTATRGQEQA